VHDLVLGHALVAAVAHLLLLERELEGVTVPLRLMTQLAGIRAFGHGLVHRGAGRKVLMTSRIDAGRARLDGFRRLAWFGAESAL